MKLGRVSETIQKRSILNLIKYTGKYSYNKSKMADPTSSVLNFGGDLVVSTMASVSGDQKDIGVYAITRAVNDIICRCAQVSGVQVTIHLPEHAYESRLKSMVQAMEEFCESIEVPLLNVQASVTSTVSTTLVTVTALGENSKADLGTMEAGEVDMDIVMIGEVGLEGALRLLSEKREMLDKRFPPVFLRMLDKKSEEMNKSIKALKKVVDLKYNTLHQVPESGILGGLWELAEGSNVGVEVQLRELPIGQEVIEICEYLGVNPYRLGAAGTVLVLAKDGQCLVEEMMNLGYQAALIGKTTAGNEKILCNGEDVRHLERPVPNELYKVLEERQEEEC